jgi:hypothetical protein
MTKKDNKRFVVRRIRRALNNAETPPTQAGRVLIRCGYGTGAGRKQIDARDMRDDDEYDFMFLSDSACCGFCYRCPFDVSADGGEGWSFETANDMEPAKLGDLIAA